MTDTVPSLEGAPIPSASLATFRVRLGYDFRDPGLLVQALSHRSWCAEHAGYESNERLEFLGDAVLGMAVAAHCYATYPDEGEGWLSRARASVVRATTLADVAGLLRVGDYVRLGKGEAASGGREKPSILADTLEALIGAVYLDKGWADAQALVLRLLGDRIDGLPSGDGDQDDKSRLQEQAARLGLEPPVYELVGEGPEHDKVFQATVTIEGVTYGSGTGRSKKQAEQVAARAARQGLLAAHDGHDDPTMGDTDG